MGFSIRKNITLKKQSPLRGLFNIIILMVAIPVVLIAIISLSIYFLFLWLKGLLRKEKNVTLATENYHFEQDLISNEYVRIIMVEDEFDVELTRLNEAWMEKVNPQETCLYRVRTIPVISALEGGICCFYCKEQNGGVLLQVLTNHAADNNAPLSSELLFLDYQNLNIKRIDETGVFFLYNDDKNAQLIRGFNRKENMRLEIINFC